MNVLAIFFSMQVPNPMRGLISSIAALVSANAASLVGGVVLHICISRVLGAELAGVYSAASATALLLAAAIDFGFDVSLPRDIAQQPEPETLAEKMMQAQAVKNVLWLVSMVIMICVQMWNVVHGAPLLASATMLFALWTLPRSYSFTYFAVLRGLMRSAAAARVEGIVTTCAYVTACGIVFVPISSSNLVLILIFFLSAVEVLKPFFLRRLVVGWFSQNVSSNLDDFSHHNSSWMFLWNLNALRKVLNILRSGQISYVLLQVCSAAEARAGIFALQMFGSMSAVGYFAASMRFATVLRTIPGALLNVLLPFFASSPSQTTSLRSLIFTGFAVTVLVSAGLSLAAPVLIDAIYSSNFRPATPILVVLAWLFPLHFITHIFEARLLAEGRTNLVNVGLLSALAVVAAWNLVFTIEHGALSAAWSIIAGQCVMFVLYAAAMFVRKPNVS
jgi:O-antigen/teichoic acid export membrane protein